MSHKYFELKNKQQKYPKVDFQSYLYNSDEPQLDTYRGGLNDVDIDVLEDRLYTKRRIRNTAQIMRKHYS
jgi:hypothetical protein